jgi:hypothetical protein
VTTARLALAADPAEIIRWNFADTHRRTKFVQHPRDTLVGQAARLLFPGRHSADLVGALGHPYPTVRAWVSGYRRLPPRVLRRVNELLRQRQIDCSEIWREMEQAILKREGEPRHLRGICAIRSERSGREGSIGGGACRACASWRVQRTYAARKSGASSSAQSISPIGTNQLPLFPPGA